MLLQDIAYLDETMEVKEHQDIRIQDTCIHEIANHGCLTPYPKEECLSGKGLLVSLVYVMLICIPGNN